MDTKTRILQAAVRLFSDRGMKGASIRDICSIAEANIAAVNYYFGGKESLYAASIKSVLDGASDSVPMPRMSDDPTNPEGQLGHWVEWLVRKYSSPESATLMKFIRREIAEPGPESEPVLSGALRPMYDELDLILAGCLPGDSTACERKRARDLVMGPTMNRLVFQPVVEKLGLGGPDEDIDALVRFSRDTTLAGIRAMSTCNA